jgi:hypothetical protein
MELKMYNGDNFHPHFVRAGGYWWRFATRTHHQKYRESLRPGTPYCPPPHPVCRAISFPVSNDQSLAAAR